MSKPDVGDDETVAAKPEPTLPLPGSDATMPARASGNDATLPLPPTATDATLALGSEPPTARAVAIRAGAKDDYRDLVAIDPKHYVLGKEIARGGMGRILIARDRRLGRDVAIKELLHDSGDFRLRFEREARITAKLQHPAIVNILEAGSWPNGEPFYVMKLVTGESLAKVIEERATLAERLALLPNVIAVVDAIAFAHARRVIHRDLKPANVLVGEFGETVVIDWGLAKDISELDAVPADTASPSRPGETMAGSVMGTPAYMPAEQAVGGVVDERADVYALGAMLYHLLAGAPPYAGTRSDEILVRIIKEPPLPIDAVVAGVPPDLVAIVGKAMAHKAPDRYSTASELAADLKRFQTGQLVGAHRYSPWQLVRRWVRRHRTAVVVATVALAALAVIAIASVRRIVREQERTEEQRVVADKSRGQAEDLMGFMLGDLKVKLEPVGKLPVLAEVAEKALAYYADRPLGDDDDDDFRRSQALANIADVLQPSGDLPGALARHREALAIRDRLGAKRTEWRFQAARAQSHQRIGDVLRAQGKLTDALAEYTASAAVLDAGTPDRENRHARTVVLDKVGYAHEALGDVGAAATAYTAARDLRVALVAEEPANADYQLGLSASHENVGAILEQRGDLTATLAAYRKALAIREQLVKLDPQNPRLQAAHAITLDKLGRVLIEAGDSAGALAVLETGLAIKQALAARDRTNAGWQEDEALGHNRLGQVLGERGDNKRALAEFRAAIAINLRLVEIETTGITARERLAGAYDNEGYVLEGAGDLAGALVAYRASKAQRDLLIAKDPNNPVRIRNLSISVQEIADVLRAQKATAAALAMYEQNLVLSQQLAAKDPKNTEWAQDLAISHARVGNAQFDLARHTDALASYRAAGAITTRLVGVDPENTRWQRSLSVNHTKVGNTLLAQKDAAGALAEYRAAKVRMDGLLAKDPKNATWMDDMIVCHGKIGNALLTLGDKPGALAAYKEALAVAKQLYAIADEPATAAYIKEVEAEIRTCCR